MLRTFTAAAILAMTTLPANAFLATNKLLVRDTEGGTFEVPYRGLSGPSDFWCAAGDYVIRELNLPPDTRIYRTSSPPRRSGQGMTFSLSSEGAKATGLAFFSRGRGVTASHARQLCEVPRFQFDDE